MRATLATRKRRRIQIVPEIKADRANWRFVAHSHSDGVGDVAVIALQGCAVLVTESRVLLAPATQIVKEFMAVGKYVTRIVEYYEADIVLHEWQGRGRKAKFDVVQKQSCAPERKSSKGIAWSCLI